MKIKRHMWILYSIAGALLGYLAIEYLVKPIEHTVGKDD